MSLILVTREEANEGSLMHFRTPGSKNGRRLYQYEDGSLTPLGRIHYGVGKGREKGAGEEKKKPTVQKSDKEIEKDLKEKIANFNEKKKSRAEARAAQNKAKEDQRKEARKLSDEELNKRINRLNQEKTYAKLLEEREEHEKSEFSRTVSKLVKNAAEDLGRKGLTMVVDQIIAKAKDKADGKSSFKLADYKNVDVYSLDSEKIRAVSQAFQDAANIAANQYKIAHPQNNDGGNQNNNQQNQKNNPNSGAGQSNSAGQNSTRLSKGQRKSVRSLVNSGKSMAEVAKQFGVSESTIRDIVNAGGGKS